MNVPGAIATQPDATLAAASGRFRDWMFNEALPFWSTIGFEGRGRGFVEYLTLDGRPAEIGYKRVRVQARQIYVFSNAAVLGWTAGLEAATDAFEFLLQHGRREDGAWVRRLGRIGGVVDSTADLYDLAFVLFALAWYHRATGRPEPIALAHRTLDWIEANMRIPGLPGFKNTLPAEPGPRQQNPHMHLLEAALALYESSGDERFAWLAEEMLTLFERHLFDIRSGTLAEFFNPDWQRLHHGPAGAVVEPGHHFEWAWLLHAAHRLTGRDLRDAARVMYNFAAGPGTDASTGLVFDSMHEDGSLVDRSTRLWPQTEAIKAHLAMQEAEGVPIEPAVGRIVDNLLGRFLAGAPRGTWIDHFTAEGQSRVDKVPSSSLYHLFFAYAELHRVAGCSTGL